MSAALAPPCTTAFFRACRSTSAVVWASSGVSGLASAFHVMASTSPHWAVTSAWRSPGVSVKSRGTGAAMAKGGRKRLRVVPTGVHRKKVTTKALGPATLFVD